MEMLRWPLAVKTLEWIRYNEQPPEGLFDMPAGARIVDKEIDALVHPDAGILAEGLSPEQACVEIMTTIVQAITDEDRETFQRLFMLPLPDRAWQKLLGQRPMRLEHDEPYREGDCWYLPCRLISSDGRTQNTTPMIKFYEIEGKTYGFRIGSKEHGVID